jgi:hemoglobin
MKRLIPFLYFVLLSFAPVVPVYAAAPPKAAPGQKSLYERLGGYDALAAVSDDFLGRLASDPQLGRFFIGLSTDSKVRVRQHIVDFLCVATAGPCKYTGRDMKTAHTGLNISEADWNQMVKLLGQTFAKFNVPEKERTDVVGALAGLKGDIVGR